MIDTLLRKFALFETVTPGEAAALRDAVARVEAFDADTEIAREGSEQTVCRLIYEGWAGRTKSLASGKRQVTETHLPGDFVDLHGLLMPRLDHSIIALTRCRTAVIPHDSLRRITDTEPRLTRMLWQTTVIDAAIHRQWLAVLAQLPAVAQVAHLFCEFDIRLERIGMAREHSYDLPLTQEEVADCLGMTSVHVNRMIQQLRGDGLIEWRRGRLTILDWDRLVRLAEFDAAYLGEVRETRALAYA